MAGTSKNVTTAFTYNPAGQIATLTRGYDLYAYTAATNLNRGYTVNGLNQATAFTGKTRYPARRSPRRRSPARFRLAA